MVYLNLAANSWKENSPQFNKFLDLKEDLKGMINY